MKKSIEKLLYKSLDATLSQKETDLLNMELNNSVDLKSEYKRIIEMRDIAAESADPDFKPRFEERLIERLYPNRNTALPFNNFITSLSYSFREIVIAALIILVLLLSYNLKHGNIYSIENLLGKSGSTIEYAFDPIQNIIGSNNQ